MKNVIIKNGWDILNLLLLLILFGQIIGSFASPSLITILSKDLPPRALHGPQAVEKNLIYKIEQVGTPINTEDIIRELHRNPALVKDNPRLQKQLEQLQQTQKELLQSEERLLSIEEELNQISLEMLEQLTTEQRELLLKNRNLDSVQKIEQEYWQELIQGYLKQ